MNAKYVFRKPRSKTNNFDWLQHHSQKLINLKSQFDSTIDLCNLHSKLSGMTAAPPIVEAYPRALARNKFAKLARMPA